MKISKIQAAGIKVTLALIAVAYLIYRLMKFEHWDQAGQRFAGAMRDERIFFLLAALILVYLNFSFEAIKWQRLVNRLEPVTFKKALSGVLTSLAMAIATPNRTGDILTRGLILKPGHRMAATGHTFLCTLAQMAVTIALGLIGAATWLPANHFMQMTNRGPWIFTLTFSVITGMAVLFLYFRTDRISRFLQRYSWLNAVNPGLAALREVSISDRAFVLLFSFLKFLTYSAQFYLILEFFGIHIPMITALSAIALFYMIILFIPVPTIGDLGVRGSVAILIIGPYTTDIPAIVFTAFAVWIINIMIPALAGLVLLRKIRLDTVEIPVENCPNS